MDSKQLSPRAVPRAVVDLAIEVAIQVLNVIRRKRRRRNAKQPSIPPRPSIIPDGSGTEGVAPSEVKLIALANVSLVEFQRM